MQEPASTAGADIKAKSGEKLAEQAERIRNARLKYLEKNITGMETQ